MKLHEDDRQKYKETILAVVKEKKADYNIKCRIYDKMGKLAWMKCSGRMAWNWNKTQMLFCAGSLVRLNWAENIDPITGMKRLPDALEQACSENREMMILCFSLNNFYEINRLLGRREGDRILSEVGYELQKEMGENFLFIRMNGMKFMALSQKLFEPEQPVQMIRQIIQNVYRRHGVNIIYPCSVGLLRCPRDGNDIDTLLESASLVIRQAKVKFECGYVDFSTDLAQHVHRRSGLLLVLNDCINRQFEGFRIVLQPQVEAKTGFIYGGEILLRWRLGKMDIPPDQFIPVLELSGLIIPVGKWVIRQIVLACRRILKVRPDFLISFNVSFYQIIDETLLGFLKSEMEAQQIKTRNIMIELTEPHSDKDPAQVEQFVNNCRKLGIKVAMDDFGTAFSGLRLLLKYPVDMVKLDRSLLKEMTSFEAKRDFLISIVYACHRFKKKVCIEGVETKEEYKTALMTDCDYIQSFYFYKPLEIEDVCQILQNSGEKKKCLEEA